MQAQVRLFEYLAKFVKDGFELKRVVVLPSLGRGQGQRLALVVGQEEGSGGAGALRPW